MQESSFLTLQNWVANVDVQRFEVLLCIGNKADLVPDHGAHVEYRRRMQRNGESSTDPHPEYLIFGIMLSLKTIGFIMTGCHFCDTLTLNMPGT